MNEVDSRSCLQTRDASLTFHVFSLPVVHLACLVMFHRVLLGAALLVCCTGESLVHDSPEMVLAFAGTDVILPCSFNITDSSDFPTVEWSKEGLQPDVIFLYRDGCETHEMKHPAFEYRTSLITKELQNGNISLRISDVQLSDAGKYQCMRLQKNTRHITTVELVVGAVSEPKLSVISAESAGVTLQCEANCWLPKPEIKFLDDQGNIITADDPKRDQEPSGCHTVKQTLTLQDAPKRVTCRVNQREINQTRDTEILIPVDCMRSCSLTTGIAVGEAILLLALCGLAFYLWKRYSKSEENGQKMPVSRQPSDQSMGNTYEKQPFLKSVRDERADNVENSTIEELRREVADLQSKLREKEETINQLQNNNKSQRSQVVCHHDKPTISPSKSSPDVPKPYNQGPEARNLPSDHSPKPTASTNISLPVSGNVPRNKALKSKKSNPTPIQRQRINSCPDFLDFSLAMPSSSSLTSTSKKKLCKIGRSLSVSCAHPVVPKFHRQHSLVPTLSNNRFKPLENLKEDLE